MAYSAEWLETANDIQHIATEARGIVEAAE